MTGRRVVVTGMGAVTPYGVGADCLWDALVEGRSGITPVTLFDTAQFDARIGGECVGFDPADHLDRKLIKRLDRFAQFALIATDEAFRSSGLDLEKEDAERLAVVFGSGIGGMNELEQQFARLHIKGPSKVSAFTIPKLMVNAASGNISIFFGAKGISLAVSSACASATNAMGEAMRIIQAGRADVVFTGGSEAALTPLALAAFASMKALSRRNDEPTKASRPFDKGRDGFVMSEGAGALIFEEFEHARRRGAPILVEVIGFGASSDAGHLTQPLEDGSSAAVAMERAIQDAGIPKEEVDYINAHATGTPLGDLAETAAIKRVFGDWAKKLVVTSTKGAGGHGLGASGGIELIATIRAIQHGIVPPTANLDEPDEGCDLDLCPNTARDQKLSAALNNSFGFGGHNACLLIRKL